HLVHYVRLEDGGSRFSFHTPIESRFLKKEKAARDFSDSLFFSAPCKCLSSLALPRSLSYTA
ncbi:MAG: hypothetical protein ABSA01_11635, partial [Anaerolineales bacterium]